MSSQINEAFPGTLQSSTVEQIGTFAAKVDSIANDMKEAKDTDTARYAALKAELDVTAKGLTELQAKNDAEVREAEVKAALEMAAEFRKSITGNREPSKAQTLGSGRSDPHEYEPGSFIGGIHDAAARDAERQVAGKAALAGLGLQRQDAWGKSTLGNTDAAGGWVIPNAIVEEFVKPAAVRNIYRELMTPVSGVTAATIDVPFRSTTRARAVVAAFGATKENLDLAYNGYTVTMYTLARIYDIGNQFLRQSRGAAEQDVLQELSAAFALGESYYIREGSGSSQPFGYTSALNNAQPAFRSAFTASSTTLAGSIAKAVATASGALAGRGVTPTAAVLSAASYWNMVSQGTDTAGFFFAPAGGPTAIRPGTLMSPFGLPVYADPGADNEATSAVTDNLTVADWKAFKVFFGQDYRVDSSDQAGSRWDTNLTGFRGEEEMGFDARPAVYAGYAQQIQDIEP